MTSVGGGDLVARSVPAAQRPLRGRVALPGSKSLTQRALVIAALARGRSRIERPLVADDPQRLASALREMGVLIETDEAGDLWIEGVGGVFDGEGRLDLGEGATGARFCLALAGLAASPVTVDGGPRLRQRPMEEGIAMLRALGGTLRELHEPGRLPIEVEGGGLRGGSVEVGRTQSSQFLSAALLAAPAMNEGIDLRLELDLRESPTSASYLWMTIAALRAANVEVALDADLPPRDDSGSADARRGPRRIMIPPQSIAPRTWSIEADASTAIFFAVAAALLPGSQVELAGLPIDSLQPDSIAIRRLGEFGVGVEAGASGVLISASDSIHGVDIDASEFPDAVPALAVLASRANSASTLRGLETLRVKESDRIEAIAENLRRLGARVETGPAELRIEPIPNGFATPVWIDPYRDHRIAMAFAVLGLARPGLAVADPEVVAKSDPDFWDRLDQLVAPSV